MFDKFLDISPDIFCVANKEGYFVKVSKSFERVLGYSNEEALSKPFYEFLHPDDLEKTQMGILGIINGEALSNFENRYLSKNGTYKLLSWASSFNQEDGLIYGIARDVTDYKRKEKKLELLNSSLFEHAIVAFTDKKGVITEVNDHFCKISGYDRDELIGQTHRIINSKAHSQEFWQDFWNTLKAGNTWAGTLENRAKDGSHYFVFSIISPEYGINGEIDGYMAIRFEVTNEVNLRNNLARALRTLNETNSIAKVGGWELIVETGELNWTDETFKILEVEKKNDSKPMLEEGVQLFIDEHVPIIEKAVSDAIEHGRPYSLELQAKTAKGNILWVYTNGQAHYENGKVTRLSGTIQNIDKRKSTEEKIIQEQKKAEQNSKLATLGELSAGIAHEINNPLTVILGNINLLKNAKNNPEMIDKINQSMEKSCNRLLSISKQLTKYSRASEDDDLISISLEHIVNEALELVTSKVKRHRCQIKFESSCDERILCNQVEIEQVIINLINNAVDAMEDLEEKWVELNLEKADKFIVLTIKDAGNGIAEDIAQKLFEPFYTSKEAGKGTGLGLSISKGIMERHNSHISIDHASANTCFVLKFPIHQV